MKWSEYKAPRLLRGFMQAEGAFNLNYYILKYFIEPHLFVYEYD
jgi:hypothetical protein